MIDDYEAKLDDRIEVIQTLDKVSGDLRSRVEYLEKQIYKHNQNHKDQQIVFENSEILIDAITD